MHEVLANIQKQLYFFEDPNISERELRQRRKQILLLQYEGLCVDFERQCRRLLQFFGLNKRALTKENIEEVAEETSFDRLRDLELKGSLQGKARTKTHVAYLKKQQLRLENEGNDGKTSLPKLGDLMEELDNEEEWKKAMQPEELERSFLKVREAYVGDFRLHTTKAIQRWSEGAMAQLISSPILRSLYVNFTMLFPCHVGGGGSLESTPTPILNTKEIQPNKKHGNKKDDDDEDKEENEDEEFDEVYVDDDDDEEEEEEEEIDQPKKIQSNKKHGKKKAYDEDDEDGYDEDDDLEGYY
jgi:hypothetical protein